MVVHDAARPLAPASCFEAVVAARAAGADGAVPGVPVADTLARGSTASRRRPATDGGGRADPAGVPGRGPAARRTPASGEATDDAALVEAAGGRVVVVPGEPADHEAHDTATTCAVARGPARDRAGDACGSASGFDVHPFTDDPGRPLVLGGVRFDGERGLAGHSDADVVAHAVADALLGAAGLGDLGEHFPDTDPAWAGADSLELLRRVRGLRAADAGWQVGNVDCAVVLEAPRLAPHRDAMQERLSAAVGAPGDA